MQQQLLLTGDVEDRHATTTLVVVTLFGSAPGSDDVINLDTRALYITLFIVFSDPQ